MKKILITASLFFVVTIVSFGQKKKKVTPAKVAENTVISDTPYLRDKTIPEFSLLLNVRKHDTLTTSQKKRHLNIKELPGGADTTWFTNKDIPANRPAIIIYFSPECGHCISEMKEIIKNMDSLKKAFFVMGSFHPLDSLKSFGVKFNLKDYNNIVVGRDEKYFLVPFYKVQMTPFVALYDNNKKLVKAYTSGINMHELIELLKTIPADKRSR